MSFNIFGNFGSWQRAMHDIFTRYQGQSIPGSYGVRRYRVKRKIRNRIAKLSRRKNRK